MHRPGLRTFDNQPQWGLIRRTLIVAGVAFALLGGLAAGGARGATLVTLYVDNTQAAATDTGNDCQTQSTPCETISFAVSLANAMQSTTTTIDVLAGAYDEAVTITDEPSTSTLAIVGNPGVTVTAPAGDSIFTATATSFPSGKITLSGLTITGAQATGNGGGLNDKSAGVNLTNDTFSNNSAINGGAVDTQGGNKINGVTFVGNSASNGGGAIANNGGVTVTNSTFANNSAVHNGGAIITETSATIKNDTFVGNSAATGGSIYNQYAATITGSIFDDGPSAGSNCVDAPLNGGPGVTDGGYNASDNSDCGMSAVNHDVVDAAETGAGGINLASLADNGGPTQTIALGSGSAAIDYIPTSTGLCPATDQRGDTRPDDGENACDVGAYESDLVESVALAVVTAGSGTGTVTSSPAGIDCGSTCSAQFAQGTQVTLTASPASGSTFTGWSGGGCSGTGDCQVTMSGAESVTATFDAAPTHTLTISKSGSGAGSVTSSPAGIDCGSSCSMSFDEGTVVTLTATPGGGSTFTGWSGGGCSGSGTCEVTMSADESVTATFAPSTHTLTISKSGTGSGSVTSSPAGIDCGSSCSAQFNDGTAVALTATADAGSTFSGWSGGGCSGARICQPMLGSDATVTATFTRLPAQSATLTVSRAGSGGGTVTSSPAGIDCGSSCSGVFAQGTQVTLSAAPASQSRFEGWSGACATTSTTCTVTLSADLDVTASFVAVPTINSLSASPRTFKAASRGPNTVPLTPRNKLGTVVGYVLNRSATVRFSIERLLPGRTTKQGRRVRCVAPAKRNGKSPHCTRTVVMRGSFAVKGKAGRNSFRYTGRLAGKALAPGGYVLVASPSADGIAGTTVRVAFRVRS